MNKAWAIILICLSLCLLIVIGMLYPVAKAEEWIPPEILESQCLTISEFEEKYPHIKKLDKIRAVMWCMG